MKKTLLITLTLALTTATAFAKKIEVTNDVLKEIVDADALGDARVYLSDKLLIERKSDLEKTSEVDDNINRVVKQSILKEQIGKKIKGKIIAVEGKEGMVTGKEKAEVEAQVKTIYVSFEPSCETKECAFAFKLPGELRYDYNRYSYESYHTYIQDGYEFNLAAIPAVEGLKVSKMEVGRLFGNPDLYQDGVTLRYARYDGIRLLIDLEELRQIQVEKKKYEGF